MADCCAEVKAELAALRAEVSKLGKVDEESIIRKAVDRADQKLSPPISAASALAGEAFGTATAAATGLALLRVVVADIAAGLGGLRAIIAPLVPAIAGLVARVAALAAGLAAAVSSIAVLAAAVAGVLAAIGLIYALMARVDALEGYVDTVASTASRALDTALTGLGIARTADKKANTALGQIPGVRSTAETANSKATEALAKIPGISAIATAALSLAGTAQGIANKAIDLAGSAYNLANSAVAKAESALSQILDVRALAVDAKRDATNAIALANNALGQISAVKQTADTALSRANTATDLASNALGQIPTVKQTADTALSRANTATDLASNALGQIPAVKQTADTALSRANIAQTTATQAITIAQEALRAKSIPGVQGMAGAPGRDGVGKVGAPGRDGVGKVGAPGRDGVGKVGATGAVGAPGKDANLDPALLQRISRVETQLKDANLDPALLQRVSRVEVQIKEQDILNKQAVTLIQQLPTVIEPRIVNSVTRTVAAIVPKSIEQAAAEIQQHFNRVAEANQAALAPQFQKTIDANRAAIAALSIPLTGALDNINKGVTTVVSSTATGANASTKKIEQTLTDIQGDLDFQNTGTKRTLDELGKIGGLITALPLAFVRNPAVQQAAVTAAAAANCQTAAPGGCTDVMNKRNNLNLGNLLGAGNAAANAAQLALLNGIRGTVNVVNTKLGSTALQGGISGAVNGLINNAAVDRVLQLVSVAGILHNCMMLSNQIGQTLFSMLDNVFAIPTLIKDPNGATIDTKGAFTKYLDGIFANVFGVTEWQAIKSQWKAYSTIYNTGSQVFGNIRDIIDEKGQINEVTNRWVSELGNGLQDEGLIGENNWETKDPTARFKGKYFARLQRIADGLQQVENVAEDLEQVTQSARSIVETANEIKENAATINKAVSDANAAAVADRAAKEEGLDLPNFSLGDLF
jgi:hypothetical protein